VLTGLDKLKPDQTGSIRF
ncbi:hypothetical protein CP02DC23_1207B, partial [Chlamydia psittaci 02DC23]